MRFNGEQDYDDVSSFLDNGVLPFKGAEKLLLSSAYDLWVELQDEYLDTGLFLSIC